MEGNRSGLADFLETNRSVCTGSGSLKNPARGIANPSDHRSLLAARSGAKWLGRSHRSCGGHTRGTLEDGFHIVIMILIEPTNLLGLLRTLQLSSHVTVLRTVARIDRRSAVCPQLPLGAETMRGLDQRDEQRGSDRADRRNLAQ